MFTFTIHKKRYVVNTELHIRYYLFLFIARVFFAQEYIYHETAGYRLFNLLIHSDIRLFKIFMKISLDHV